MQQVLRVQTLKEVLAAQDRGAASSIQLVRKIKEPDGDNKN